MQLFYATQIESNLITLSEQESSHCTRVLRMNRGDEMQITDGIGHFYTGIIQLAHDKKTTVEITKTIESAPLPYQLHLYVALTKHADRLEWMLEKCIEIGLTSFTPLITQRTERRNIRVDRLTSIALSAMKQSLKAWLPLVHPPVKFTEVVKSISSGSKLIAHCANDEKKIPLHQIHTETSVHIFIGPEGDFTSEEVSLAHDKGFESISLGPSRLRTETAGVLVTSSIYLSHL